MRALLPLALVVSLASPAAADDIALTGHAADDIALTGHIDAAMAARMHAALADGKPHVLHVNSSGGDELPALALAQDIRHARAEIVVDGLCAGPCANALFIAASQRQVMPGGLVIFAASASSRLAMVPPSRTKEVMPSYAEAAGQENQLMAEMHADPALLLEPQLKLGTKCWSLTSRNPAGQAYVNYQAQFVGWIPSRSYLAHAGVKVGGFWPVDAAQFKAAMKAAFPLGATGAIAFSGADHPSAQSALLARLRSVKECDTGLKKR